MQGRPLPPSAAWSFFQSQIIHPHQMSYIPNLYFILFTLAATSHYRKWEGESIATEPRTRHCTATTLFEAPSQIREEQAPPMNMEGIESSRQYTQDARMPAIMSGSMSGMTMLTPVSWGAVEYGRSEILYEAPLPFEFTLRTRKSHS